MSGLAAWRLPSQAWFSQYPQKDDAGSACLFESGEHHKIPVKVLGGNTIAMFQHFFQSAMQAVERIPMVYLVIVSVRIQNDLHTVLFFH